MMRMNHEMTINQQDNDTKIKVAEIQAFMGQMDQDSNDNQVPDQLEIERLKHEVATSQQDRMMEDKKLNSEKEENQKDRELKREEMKSKERIAKSKPKPKTGK